MGDIVLILGGGFNGILFSQLSKLHGASKVIVSEPMEKRAKILLQRGADIVINPFENSIEELVMDETEGLGADLVIEAAGKKVTAQQSINLVSKCGTVMFYGVVPPGETIEIEPNIIFEKELNIIGSNINPFQHYRVIKLLKNLNLRELITHHFSLENIMQGIEIARQSSGIKICIKPKM